MTEFETELLLVKQETHDVKTFRFRRPEGLKFISGQYLIISFINKLPGESRPFTFATSPTTIGSFELTIKKMGDFTDELFKTIPSTKFKINGPNGEKLNFDETVKDEVVFLAGGSGITPFISAIRFAISKKLPNKITLVFGNRTIDDIIFRDELETIAKENKNIEIFHIISEDVPDDWPGEQGFMTREVLERYVKEPNKIWYVCGPPVMIDSIKKILNEMNIPPENVRIENWQLPGKN
jgi:NAD(P)H-flavin reductase